jgi:hypothetical protein
MTLAFGLALASCSFTEIPPPPGSVAVNRCEGDEDCGSGRCRENICVSTSTKLGSLLVEVTPPTNVPDLGGLSFYTILERPSGNIAIAGVETVSVSIAAPVDPAAPIDPACSYQGPPPDRDAFAPSGGTIPATLSFVPSERVLGIAANAYVAVTGMPEGFKIGDPYTSKTSLPPGAYDIYVEPRVSPGFETCDVPPVLLRGQNISGIARLAIELPPPAKLNLHVRGPALDRSLEGWSVAVLDSVSGRVISVPRVLPEPTTSDTGSEYVVEVPFVPAQVARDGGGIEPDPTLAGNEIVRLSPPAPPPGSFFFERAGLRLSNDPAAPDVIDLTPPNGYSVPATPLPPIVTIEGQTSAHDTGLSVAAAVTLVSDQLEGTSRQASFITTIQVDETGLFTAYVPQGDYFVRATPPPSLGLSAAEAYWELRASEDVQSGVQGGKTIQLARAPQVTGAVSVNGSPVFGATASTVVSPFSMQQTVLARTLAKPIPVPRTSANLVEGDGRFAVSVDPGRYDFFVRPETRSHYPWLVLPSIDVPDGGLELQRRQMTFPYVYRGEVVVDETPRRVPGALIRAYVFVTDPNDATKSAVIPVAESRADESGAFELLIPASLDKR